MNKGLRFGRFLLALAAAIAACSSPVLAAPEEKPEKKPAGAVLVFQVAEAAPQDVDMPKLIAPLKRRINPGWIPRAWIRELPGGRVEITVRNPDPANVQRIERLVLAAGTLEFRITANDRDHRSIIERAKQLNDGETKVLGEDKTVVAWWVPVAERREESSSTRSYVTRKVKDNRKDVMQVLVVADWYNVTGAYLTKVAVGSDQRGRPDIEFTFNSTGGRLFGALTSANLPDPVQDVYRHLAIILDGYVYSAPRIQSTIRERGRISGDFTQREAQDIVDILNAGALPARLKRVPDAKSGP